MRALLIDKDKNPDFTIDVENELEFDDSIFEDDEELEKKEETNEVFSENKEEKEDFQDLITEEELESVMRQGQSTLEKSSGMELGEDALSGTVYEMMASSISGFPNVSLVVEDASLENMTVDQYFLAAQQMLDATGMGYTYSDVTDIQIAGQDFRVMETSVAVNDYEVLQKYCTRKQGGKFVSIILSYTTDTTAEADEILAAFTPLNTDTEAAPAE